MDVLRNFLTVLYPEENLVVLVTCDDPDYKTCLDQFVVGTPPRTYAGGEGEIGEFTIIPDK